MNLKALFHPFNLHPEKWFFSGCQKHLSFSRAWHPFVFCFTLWNPAFSQVSTLENLRCFCHHEKNKVDFTGYPSNHFPGCRLNGRLTQNWVGESIEIHRKISSKAVKWFFVDICLCCDKFFMFYVRSILYFSLFRDAGYFIPKVFKMVLGRLYTMLFTAKLFNVII